MMVFYLRNKFHFSEVHGSLNTTGQVQSKWQPKGVMLTLQGDPLRSYFHEPQKNEIHLLYLHFVFTLFLFNICGIFYLNLANTGKRQRKVIIRSVRLLRSTAVTLT